MTVHLSTRLRTQPSLALKSEVWIVHIFIFSRLTAQGHYLNIHDYEDIKQRNK